MRHAPLLSALLLGGCCLGSVPGLSGPVTVVTPGFQPDPIRLAGTGGGPLVASTLDGSCRGWLPVLPSHTLEVTAPLPFLRVMAASETDTTLLVRLADGRILCNDDTDGMNPIVDLTSLPQGTHQVYVGTYARGASAPYQLGITASPSLTPTTAYLNFPGGPPIVEPPPQDQLVGASSAFTVAFISGNLPGVSVGSTCIATQARVPNPEPGLDCRWQVICDGQTLYGDGQGGYNPCSDPVWPAGTLAMDIATSGTDRDPSLVINAGGLMIRDDAHGARGAFHVTAVHAVVPVPGAPSTSL